MSEQERGRTRREFVMGGTLAASAMLLGERAAGAAEDAADGKAAKEPTLKSRFLFSMEAELEPPQEIGDRRIFVAKSGTVEGERVRGTLLPGGGDWSRKRSDGTTMLDVRGTLRTDDDQLIYVWYNGIVATKPNGIYFRTTPYFETASEKYAWLNSVVAVGVFKIVPGRVAYNVFEIL